MAKGLRFYAHYRGTLTFMFCGTQCSSAQLGLVHWDVLILNTLILGTVVGEREGTSSKLVLSSEGIGKALSSPPAESQGCIIESVGQIEQSFRAGLPFFISSGI